jgi:hypothetical protein
MTHFDRDLFPLPQHLRVSRVVEMINPRFGQLHRERPNDFALTAIEHDAPIIVGHRGLNKFNTPIAIAVNSARHLPLAIPQRHSGRGPDEVSAGNA